MTFNLGKGCGFSIIKHRSKQATVIESRYSGRAYELVDDDGKTYYRGRRFLLPVQYHPQKATVFRCYTNETEESAEHAMESDKPTYSAILSRDKEAITTTGSPNINVNVRLHRPRFVPIDPTAGITNFRRAPLRR